MITFRKPPSFVTGAPKAYELTAPTPGERRRNAYETAPNAPSRCCRATFVTVRNTLPKCFRGGFVAFRPLEKCPVIHSALVLKGDPFSGICHQSTHGSSLSLVSLAPAYSRHVQACHFLDFPGLRSEKDLVPKLDARLCIAGDGACIFGLLGSEHCAASVLLLAPE